MNYENINELIIDEKTHILIKTKNDVALIEVELKADKYKEHMNEINDLMHQMNDESTFGFFFLHELKIYFCSVINEKVEEKKLNKYVNGSIAAVLSFNNLLEVLFNEQ